MALKRGFMFTMDAFLSAVILITGLMLISQMIVSEHPKESLQYGSFDILSSLSEIKMLELDSGYVSTLSSTYTDVNLSVLEQIGTYWAVGEEDLASNLSAYVLAQLIPPNTGLSLVVGNASMFEQNTSFVDDLVSADRMITGIIQGAPLTGSTSSAYLRRINDKRTRSYAYFGGFVGQGNISTRLELPADFVPDHVTKMIFEGDVGVEFTLEINGVDCGELDPDDINMTPTIWEVTHCNASLASGTNTVALVFDEDISESYIAGGYLRVDYKTDILIGTTTLGHTRYYFPSIEGVANLYDSFYIPGSLQSMEIYLHYDSNYKTYLDIGNVNIHQKEAAGDETAFLNDTNLTSFPINLNYDDLSNKTIPLRFASYNDSTYLVFGSNADVVLITDKSGSMKLRMNSWTLPGNAMPGCKVSDFLDPKSRRLGVAGCLDSIVNSIIMNSSKTNNTNRLFLSDFSDSANPFFTSNLALITEANVGSAIFDRYKNVDPKEVKGGTCLCCSINQAYDILSTYSNDERSKSVIVMTDGVPNFCCGGYWSGGVWTCNETATGTTGAWPMVGQTVTCDGTEGQCVGGSCSGPMNAAINAAKRLHDDLNVTVYAIGFGPIETCDNANYTVAKIAEAGNGTYLVSSDAAELELFYKNISYDILSRVAQNSQIVISQGLLNPSTLYPDSYIDFTYVPNIDPPAPNEIDLPVQTTQFGSCNPTITIPSNIRVSDAKVVSYSDYHWTDSLVVDGIDVFNLSSYSSNYTRLGDPYMINVPAELLTSGIHSFAIRTGDNPWNSTGCSPNNSLVYQALVPSATSRSEVVEKTEGCIWTIQFEDDTTDVKTIPSSYSGAAQCSYTAANHTIGAGAYDPNDAYDIAVFMLLKELDFDGNGKVFVNLESEDIEIIITTISSVPYMWGPTLVKASVWQ